MIYPSKKDPNVFFSTKKTPVYKYPAGNQFKRYWSKTSPTMVGEKAFSQKEISARYLAKNFPEGQITMNTVTVGGKQYNLPSIKKKEKWKQFIKFIQQWKKNPTITNYVTLSNKLDKWTQNIATSYRKWLKGEALTYRPDVAGGATAKVFESINKDLGLDAKQIKEYKTYTRPIVAAEVVRLKATPRASETALGKSAEMVKRLNRVFKENPNISLKGIAAKLNGRAYAMGDNAARLAMTTEASNGVAKYLEALQDARKIKNWVPPTGKNKDKIIKNILEGTEGGFRFQEGTLRRYKFNIRDALLKNPQFTSETLRNKLRNIGVVDEAVGLSATYKAAPGYTELVQFLPKKTNIEKGIQIDRPFKDVLTQATKGEFGNVKEFNKIAEGFGKKWNIDVPRIRPGGDPTQLIKYFEYLSPEAKKNILELSKGKSGFAIESAALPWGEMGTRVAELKQNKPAFQKFLEAVVKSPAACRRILNYQVGGAAQSCAVAIKTDPVGTAEKISKLKVTGGALGKVKNAATTFLGMLGRGGVKAAPLAALAAAGAAIEPLVKQFRNDDPSTYLTDESQMKGMLLATIEGETPKVDEEILKWQYPGLGAATAAGAIPGAGEVYKARRGLPPTKDFIGPMKKGVGPTRAALGITGVLGKALGASFSPLAVLATLPVHVAAQRAGGTDYGDIATDPMNWMGPAFASTGAEMATRGMKSGSRIANAIRLGFSPRTLSMFTRRFGLPGLAVSAGLWGYDKWKNRSIND